jgi:hypothetical protein
VLRDTFSSRTSCLIDLPLTAYALLLHACELALKAFCDQSVSNGKPSARAPNHDLQGWYRIALQYGLPADPHVTDGIDILADLHTDHYMRYPDNRKTRIPDISINKVLAPDPADRFHNQHPPPTAHVPQAGSFCNSSQRGSKLDADHPSMR